MTQSNIEISVVSPVYRAESILDQLIARLEESLKEVSVQYEIILVNDRSPDHSWEKILEICQSNKKVKGINLSRNFGQHKAISAGLKSAQGHWIVVMDCDLQDQPEEIPKLYQKAQEGFDIVLAQRERRRDNFFKKLFSKLFYKTLSYLTDSKQDHTVANFGIYSRKTVQSVLSMSDSFKYFPTMIRWVGFKVSSVLVSHAERYSGKTSYNFKKLLDLALNIVISFSDKPLRLIVKLGLLISGISFLFAAYNIILFIQGKIVVLGYTSLIVSIWFLSGIIITLIGISGLYVGRIFEQTKNRPVYIVDEKINCDHE